MSEQSYSYSAWSCSYDGIGTITWNSAVGDRFRRWLVPLHGTTDRLKVNAYNARVNAVPTPGKAGAPNATGNIRVGLYRRVGPQGFTTAVSNFELVNGTEVVTAANFPVTGGFIRLNMNQTIDVLGGQFFICIQIEDTTPSGTANLNCTLSGHTASDANLQYAYFTTTGTAGALPATINGNICTKTSEMPWGGVYWR